MDTSPPHAEPPEEPAQPEDTLATEPDPSGNPLAGDALSGGDVVMSAAHRRRWGGVAGGEREIRKRGGHPPDDPARG